MINKKASLPIFLGLAVAIGILIGSSINFKNKAVIFSSNTTEAKIKRLINYIQYDYVDKVDTDSLLDDAITNMLVKLDPHSVYIPKEELKQVTENLQGKFVGIGVSFLMHQDTVTVTGVIEGGPSFKAGVKAGDRIIIADKDTLFGEQLVKKAGVSEKEKGTLLASRKISEAVMKSLKGEAETNVLLTVYRRSTDEVLDIQIARDEVPIKSVPGYYMINNTLGYINVERFARTTYLEFKLALNELTIKGMNSLVLDLRGNGGGYMDIANSMIDEFLEDGKLIVFTKNKNGEVDKSYATKKGDFEDGNVYVLIDQNSASASEIVAGALQDNDKGTIVGRRSFGKGLVQQEMDLGDGSAVRLTTSRYYTPTGRSIQKPYAEHNTKLYNSDYLNRVHNGELISKDSIKVIDTLKYTTPKGKIVYGGGGIIPDVFVPIDTSRTYNRMIYRGLNSFVFKYIDSHREELNAWELEDFVAKFDEDEKIFNLYLEELDLKVPMGPKSREDLKLYFKAFFARDLFDQTGYFMVTQKKDNMILKVIELENSK
ncbi:MULTISPECIES: S41 family peptidase [Flavobacteriaceae]|uniref:S41 family peptidase n=2 Tax=Flavobacteriaceae TaxID=49546 RepID=A0A4Y8AT16_9FLAO|nr:MULTISPECIES: S41 family peptidase [Flavobacteriaceae]TEW73812.1 S41 family peptidase [Gramella jeungdoensis]GGK37796.1 peptidase S41 [Lutibacter litoralis]